MTKCTECQTEGAYVGLNEVRCPNKECIHYDEEQRLERAYDALETVSDEELSDPDKTPVYPWGSLI